MLSCESNRNNGEPHRSASRGVRDRRGWIGVSRLQPRRQGSADGLARNVRLPRSAGSLKCVLSRRPLHTNVDKIETERAQEDVGQAFCHRTGLAASPERGKGRKGGQVTDAAAEGRHLGG